MRLLPKRAIATTSLAAFLLAGLAACGGSERDNAAQGADSSSSASQNGGDTKTDASADSSAEVQKVALTAMSTGDPFADLQTAASHMPMTADALTKGIVEGAKIPGEMASKAADLRAGLTSMLTEHVYLAGVAVATAYQAGADSDEFKAAAAVLDKNSEAIAAAVGSVVPDEKDNFLAAWRAHITNFVTYAVGAKTGGAKGEKMKKEAVADLTAYATQQGKFFSKITEGALPAKAVKEAFMEHITSLAAAVDSLAAGKADAFDKLKAAAHHMPMTATALSTGIAKAAKIDGDVSDKASELRSNLTYLLTEHVYLAGIAVFTAYTADGGLDGDTFKAAAGTLDKNSSDLADAVGSIAGKEKGEAFLTVWRSHINDFVTYAKGDATSDDKLKVEGLTNLDAYRTSAGQFFSDITGGALPADAVAGALKEHIETLAGAIDSLKKALIKA